MCVFFLGRSDSQGLKHDITGSAATVRLNAGFLRREKKTVDAYIKGWRVKFGNSTRTQLQLFTFFHCIHPFIFSSFLLSNLEMPAARKSKRTQQQPLETIFISNVDPSVLSDPDVLIEGTLSVSDFPAGSSSSANMTVSGTTSGHNGVSNLREYVPDKNHILEVRTISGNTFKNLLDTLKAVLNEANIVFSAEGLKIRAVDSERHALVDLFMHASSFEFYHCQERQVLGVDIDVLQKTIKTNKLNDLMCFIRHKDDPHVLEVSFENFQNNTKVSDWIKLMNLPEYSITDELSYPPADEMDSHGFQNICREMASFHATLLEIQCIGDELIFMNKDGMTRRRVVVRVSTRDDPEGARKPREDARGIFLLKFLKSFAKAASLSPRVRIYLKTGLPLICEYDVANLGKLKYLLGSEE